MTKISLIRCKDKQIKSMEKNIETVKQDIEGMFEYHVFRKSLCSK